MSNSQPVIDLHCDLLAYLNDISDADPFKRESIACSFPHLAAGNVKLQIMAIYTATKKGSTESGLKQSLIFKNLLAKSNNTLTLVKEAADLKTISTATKIGILAAIENASGFCEEDERLEDGFKKLDKIIFNTERVLYISFTHHDENRFGGGNNSKVGLKEDGKALLDYMDGKKIAVDFSHTSDALAHDIFDYLAKNSLDIPVMASHSNYRKILNHPRNLPDIFAKEIIRKKGLIGINFLRAFLNDQNPNAMYDHINHGLEIGGAESICFGADYFHTASHPDQSRKPYYFKEHQSASCYPSILENLSEHLTPEVANGISHKNVIDYLRRIWS